MKSQDIFDRKRRVGLEGCVAVDDKVFCNNDNPGLQSNGSKKPTHVRDKCDDPFKTVCKEKPSYFRRGVEGAVCAKCFERMLQKKKIQDPDEWDVSVW